MRFAYIAIPLACLSLAGCVDNGGQTQYQQQPVQQMHVRMGTITGVRNVALQGSSNNARAAGALIGAAAGAVLGHQIGEGGGKKAATIVGAGAGAVAGDQIAKQNSNQVTYHRAWTVRLDHGGILSIVQDDNSLRVGERVRVVGEGNDIHLEPR